MAKVYCKYHPAVPARWSCDQCQINFCTDCVHQEKPSIDPTCPICGYKAASLGAGNLIRPFWHRIPHFFLFPAHLTPLLFILALTALSMLVSRSLFGMLIQLVIYIVFLKYAFVVLEDMAHGHLKPKPITGSVVSDELEQPFKQIFLIFLVATVNYKVLEYFGSGPYLLTRGLSTLALPAAIMVLAIEHSFFKALNPLVLLVTITRIGAPYFILFIFLALLQIGSEQAIGLLMSILPARFLFAAINFISMYFVLIMYSMMGYVLYQYHEALGFSIEEEYQEDQGKYKKETGDPRFRHIDILIQEGKVAEAEERLIRTIKDSPGELEPREKLHRLYIVTRNQAGLQQHSADYVTRLLHMNKPSEAMRIYLEAYHITPEIKLNGAKERHELAGLLKSNGQSRVALSLLNNLHQEYPSYEGIPGAYLLVAEIMFEYFSEERKALQILDFVLKKYTGHPLQGKIKEYRQVIERMTGSGQTSA